MQQKELVRYWHHYKLIEEDFLRLAKQVEIDKGHFSVYSIELTRLLITVCAEIDAVCRLLHNTYSPGSGANKLDIKIISI